MNLYRKMTFTKAKDTRREEGSSSLRWYWHRTRYTYPRKQGLDDQAYQIGTNARA